MESFSISSHAFFFKQIIPILLSFILFASPLMVGASFSQWSDRSALLAFKSQIQDDPFKALTSWNHSLPHCNWQGITCNNRGRVTDLELPSFDLEGTLSPHIGNLTFLQKLNLTENNFHGEIPQEVGRLVHLQYICLQNNSFSGQIPSNITRCSELREINFNVNKLKGNILVELSFLSKLDSLYLSVNSITGNIPSSLGNLSSLTAISLGKNQLTGNVPNELCHIQSLEFFQVAENELTGQLPPCLYNNSNIFFFDVDTNQLEGSLPPDIGLTLPNIQELDLYTNNFTGNIPSSLSNLSSLTELYLLENHLEGSIPERLCHIQSLTFFDVGLNNLTGIFPSCFYNLSNINILAVSDNKLEGSLPQDMGLLLPKIQELLLGFNNFNGLISTSLTNATTLEVLVFSENSFTGPIPKDLGRLHSLRSISFSVNQLGTKEGNDLEFMDSLTNCSNLETLVFALNSLNGPLPESISNLSTKLTRLEAQSNNIYGNIPVGIQNLINLQAIVLYTNQLRGNIPTDIGKLNKIKKIDFSGNMLSGTIPIFLGNLTQLIFLDLSSNYFSANIPPALANCKNLYFLGLSHNKLVGRIPKQLFRLSLLALGLYLNHNFLTGSLPLQIGNLTSVVHLDVSENNLSGHLPVTLGSCLCLESLDIHKNFFQGEIPKSINALQGLQYFDLSQNNLSGEIPEYLERFPLSYLNLSYNKFKGKVPTKGVFGNASVISVVDNNNLCGGIAELKLPFCNQKSKKTSLSRKVVLTLIVGCVSLLLFLCFLMICYWRKMSKHKPSAEQLFDLSYKRVTYSELLKATNGFAHDNLIGVGSYGSVFKGVLQNINLVVAVKVLDLERKGASKSFLTECNAMTNLRHRNLLKIITSCSSVDFQGNDFKALVLEYMPRGSLEDWLHPKAEQQPEFSTLNFTQRMSIARGVASAVEYLHHNNPVVVHCDLKPSNVLLDDDMVAHVADFGIAKIFSLNVDDSEKTLTKSAAIKGSVGYVAPEYGMGGTASTKGDVYSYGILLLEMFTRKRPTDDIFVNGLSLHTYVKMVLPNRVMNVIDHMMILEEKSEELDSVGQRNARARLHECLVEVISLGVACSAESPVERMTMSEVVTKLHHIMEHYERVMSNLE